RAALIRRLANDCRDKQLACPWQACPWQACPWLSPTSKLLVATIDRLHQYMHMVRHHTIRQELILPAIVVIEIFPNHIRHRRPCQPIDSAGYIEISIVGGKELFVDA